MTVANSRMDLYPLFLIEIARARVRAMSALRGQCLVSVGMTFFIYFLVRMKDPVWAEFSLGIVSAACYVLLIEPKVRKYREIITASRIVKEHEDTMRILFSDAQAWKTEPVMMSLARLLEDEGIVNLVASEPASEINRRDEIPFPRR